MRIPTDDEWAELQGMSRNEIKNRDKPDDYDPADLKIRKKSKRKPSKRDTDERF